jgi:hypothetical protein
MTREASCSCGQLRVTVEGEPVRVREHVRYSDDEGEERRTSFCPQCGSTVFYTVESAPGFVSIPVGAFADPSFPPPTVEVYESRRHAWVQMPHGINS